ncbi:hypothetical protein LINPERHAP2_LOCUS27650 [Linum perenne]
MAAHCLWTTTGGGCTTGGGSGSQGRPLALPIFHTQIITYSRLSSSSSSYSLYFHGGCRNPNLYLHPRRFRRRNFAQLTPPQPDPPPPDEKPLTLTGVVESISRFQDRVMIFSAVFVWMFVFFWYSAWDGRNKGGGGGGFGMSNKRSKMPPFRRVSAAIQAPSKRKFNKHFAG